MTNQNTVISNLLYEANRRGVPIGKLEERIGVSKGYLSRAKRGKGMSLQTFLNALDFLSCPVEVVLDKNYLYRLELQQIEQAIEAMNARKDELKKEIEE